MIYQPKNVYLIKNTEKKKEIIIKKANVQFYYIILLKEKKICPNLQCECACYYMPPNIYTLCTHAPDYNTPF